MVVTLLLREMTLTIPLEGDRLMRYGANEVTKLAFLSQFLFILDSITPPYGV